MCTNLPEIIWHGSAGILVEPIWEAKYGVQVIIKSSWAEDRWQSINFPDSIKRWVKLHFATKMDETYYIVPRYELMSEIGCVVAIGDTMDEAIQKAEGYCKKIKGYLVTCEVGSIDKIKETIEAGKKFGLDW